MLNILQYRSMRMRIIVTQIICHNKTIRLAKCIGVFHAFAVNIGIGKLCGLTALGSIKEKRDTIFQSRSKLYIGASTATTEQTSVADLCRLCTKVKTNQFKRNHANVREIQRTHTHTQSLHEARCNLLVK